MLTLSDQQLVTGLAVMSAGYAKRCSMTTYHFNIVASLAWFSSATHLATLGALRNYLVENAFVRNWRIAGMIGLLGLLLYAQLIMFSHTHVSLPVQCVLGSPSLYKDYSDLVLLATTWGFLISLYTERMVCLFSDDPDWTIPSWIVEVLVKYFSGKKDLEPTGALRVLCSSSILLKEAR